MKTFRVTLKISRNGEKSSLSTTVPASTDNLAIETTIRAFNLAGVVVDASVEEVN